MKIAYELLEFDDQYELPLDQGLDSPYDGGNTVKSMPIEADIQLTEDYTSGLQQNTPLGQFFQLKRHSLMRSFYDITALIDERKKLKEQNLYQIAQGECEVLTRMHRLDDWLEGMNPGVDKRRSGLEKDLLDFGRQKRAEEVSAWKDVLMLKKDLRELLNDIYKEYTKQSLVNKVK